MGLFLYRERRNIRLAAMKAPLDTRFFRAARPDDLDSRRRDSHSGIFNLSGFSLVEVVLALGIMSFALMGIVGLLPVGLNHFRKAVDLTVQAQIAQALTADMQRAPYADISNMAQPSTYYYDEEGNSTTVDRKIYTATTQVVMDSELNELLAPTWMIGSSGKALSNVKAVRITITNVAFPANSQILTTYVANAGT